MKMQRWKAALMLVVAKIAGAAVTISYKLADNDEMHMKVLITYRYLFATILIFPLALVLERNQRPKLTWTILLQAFVCAIFGGPMSQNLFAESLVLTSPTFVAAFSNLIPPLTFILAVIFRLEKIEIGKMTGKAKVLGTLIGFGGAMILTLYKGHQLNLKSPHFNLLHAGQPINGHVETTHKISVHQILGSILALVYSLFVSLYFILQSKFSVKYPCHYSNTFLFSVFGFLQSLVYVVITERSWSSLKLSSKTRIFAAVFQGICSLLGVILIMAVVHVQGPLFVSIFNPLVLVFVALAGFLLLEEKLYVGTLLGSAIVILGLYFVLWAKSKESKKVSKLTPAADNSKDANVTSNTIATTMSPEILSMNRTSFSNNVDDGDELPANKSSRKKHKGKEIVEEV